MSASGPKMIEPASSPVMAIVCVISGMLDLSQTRSNWKTKLKLSAGRKLQKALLTSLFTYISNYGGLIQHVAVHISIHAFCCPIESMLSDGINVPVHRGEHSTPAEAPILLPGHSEVQLLLCGKVRINFKDPLRITVSFWVRLDKKKAAEKYWEQKMRRSQPKKKQLLEVTKVSNGDENFPKIHHLYTDEETSKVVFMKGYDM